MSNFYYCNDCKKAVDLTWYRWIDTGFEQTICKECGGTNWKPIIDTPSGEKEKKE